MRMKDLGVLVSVRMKGGSQGAGYARGICTLQSQEFSTLSFDTNDQSQIQVSDACSDSSETTYLCPTVLSLRMKGMYSYIFGKGVIKVCLLA